MKAETHLIISQVYIAALLVVLAIKSEPPEYYIWLTMALGAGLIHLAAGMVKDKP